MAVNARKLRTAALLMHFDASWVARILDEGALLLNDDELALFRKIDRRAFRADEERKARAAAAVVAEGPVAVAVAGLPRLFSYFTSADFLVVIEQDQPLVIRALESLGPVGRIEATIARARRRRRGQGPYTLAPGVDGERSFVKGSVAHWSELRASLGDDPAAAVMAGARRTWGLEVGDEKEGVVVDNGLVDPRVAACSQPLGVLLMGARNLDHDSLRALARSQGCDDDEEADALLADLVNDGLLVPPDV